MNNLISWLISLSIISIPFYLIRLSILGIPTTLHEVIVWISFLVVLLSSATKNEFKKVNKLIWIGSLLIIIGALVGFYISPDKIASAGLIKGYLITPFVLGLSVFLANKRKLIVKSLIISGLIVAISVYWDLITNNILSDGRVTGIYNLDSGASPNYISLYLAPIASFILANMIFSLPKKNWQNALLKSLVFVLLFGAIAASQSRAGIFVVLFIGLIAIYILLKRNIKYKAIINCSMLITIIILLFGVIKIASPDLSATPDSGRISSSNNIRFEIWKTTFQDIIPKYWATGVGMGQYQNIFIALTKNRVNYPEYIAPKALTPHNVFLSAWMNLGIIGLTGLLMVILIVFRKWFYLSKVSINSHNTYFIILASILLLGLFDTTIFKNDLGAVFWIAIFMINSE